MCKLAGLWLSNACYILMCSSASNPFTFDFSIPRVYRYVNLIGHNGNRALQNKISNTDQLLCCKSDLGW